MDVRPYASTNNDAATELGIHNHQHSIGNERGPSILKPWRIRICSTSPRTRVWQNGSTRLCAKTVQINYLSSFLCYIIKQRWKIFYSNDREKTLLFNRESFKGMPRDGTRVGPSTRGDYLSASLPLAILTHFERVICRVVSSGSGIVHFKKPAIHLTCFGELAGSLPAGQ